MQLSSPLLQGLVSSFQSLMSKVSYVPGALDFTYNALTRTVILFVGFVLLFAAAKAVVGDHVLIEPLSVPHNLEQDGYSGAVVSRLLLEEVQAIRQSGDALVVRDNRDADVSFQSEDVFAALATIQVPSSSLTLRSMAVMVRDFLGIPERKIGGAITITRKDSSEKAALYRVSLVLGPSAGHARSEESSDLNDAIRRSARLIARQYDPVGLAAHHIKEKDLQAARQLAGDLMEARDSDRRKQGLLIRGMYEMNLLDQIAFFQEATEEDPRFSEAYNAWGSALYRDGKTKEAIEKYDVAIRLNPLNSSALRNRAIAYKKNRQAQRAIADLAQAGRLNPTADTFFDLGYFHDDLDKLEPASAIKAYDQAIRLAPRHHWALNNRCYNKAALRDPSAVADCDKALRLNASSETHDSRGFAYLQIGQFDKAIDDYNAALTKFGSDPWHEAYSLYGRGLAKRGKGDLAEGDADIAGALKRDPEIASTMAKWGVRP
jgi:tetratricopeptide (TPR) repeat protein